MAPIGGSRRKHYQFTAIDDCTRLRVLKIYDRLNQKTAIHFVDYVFEKLPFQVQLIQTDNGAEFQSFPLARPRPRGPPRVHQAGHATAERQGRAFTPDRRREFYRCSTASCSTTLGSSPGSSRSGRTSTTSTVHTASWVDKLHTSGYAKPPGLV